MWPLSEIRRAFKGARPDELACSLDILSGQGVVVPGGELRVGWRRGCATKRAKRAARRLSARREPKSQAPPRPALTLGVTPTALGWRSASPKLAPTFFLATLADPSLCSFFELA